MRAKAGNNRREEVEMARLIDIVYDYTLQVWVRDHIIQGCTHPETMAKPCCPAYRLAGLDIREQSRVDDSSLDSGQLPVAGDEG